MPCQQPPLFCCALPQLAEAEKELKRLAFEKALALPDEKPVSEQARKIKESRGGQHRARCHPSATRAAALADALRNVSGPHVVL